MPFQIKQPSIIKIVQVTSEQNECELMSDEEAEFEATQIINEANEQATFIIREAQMEAQRLIDDAQTRAQNLAVKICENAKQAGYEDGINAAQNQYEDLIKEAEGIREDAEAEYRETMRGIETEAVSLIIDIAKKVVGQEVILNKQNILLLVKQAFEKCANREQMVLKVSDEDFDFSVRNKDKILSMVDGISNLEIKRDMSLKPGSCVIETPFGNIDAGVHTRLGMIEDAFKQAQVG